VSIVDEPARHDLYRGLEELLGNKRADTLMSMLPGAGWADVATRQGVRDDLRQLEARVDTRFIRVEAVIDVRSARVDARVASVDAQLRDVETRLDARFSQVDLHFDESESRIRSYLDRALREQTRTLLLGMVGAMFTITSLGLAALTLTT
jgi:hypothetical protein